MLNISKKNYVIYFIISLTLGILLTFTTETFLSTVNYGLVSIFLIIGVIEIISFLINKNNSDVILGTICIWISLFLYAYYAALIVMIPVVLSLYAVILGIFALLKYMDKKGKFYLIMSLFSFIIGIIMLIKPYFTIDIYLKILGIYLILSSSYYIEEIFKSKRKEKKN